MPLSKSARLPRQILLGLLALSTWPLMAAPSSETARPPAPAASASEPEPVLRGPGVVNSRMDRQLFLQVLLAEVQARRGDPGTAYQIYLEAARKHKNAQLFQRAVEIALLGRAGEQALAAAQAWRQAMPESREATEYAVQILLALGRTADLREPLESLIRQLPAEQQGAFITGLPRSLARLPDRKVSAQLVDDVTRRWRETPPVKAEAWVATGEAWGQAGDIARARQNLDKALSLQPDLPAATLLALELLPQQPDLEPFIQRKLGTRPDLVLRLAYARRLAVMQRPQDAARQMDLAVAENPSSPAAWLSLGAIRLDLRQLDAAEQALQTFLNLPPVANPHGDALNTEREQGMLLMAQVAEGRQRFAEAEQWLAKADPAGQNLRVQVARAQMLALTGPLDKARVLLQNLPETEPRDALVKANAEAQILREARQYDKASQVLARALERFPDETDLLYEQSMLLERLGQVEASEKLLRRVLALDPRHPHAHNALGYMLADRGIRLEEARQLLDQAMALKPDDPFITDSYGWLEFRAGRPAEAERWLRKAWQTKQDTEIAAHLGEVLWTSGRQEEALSIWREGQRRDADNETLKSTLKRLKVKL